MKDILADRAGCIDASGIRKVFALAAKMEDPINFSIGQPDFDVPDNIKEAAIDAIRNGSNAYTQTAGDAQLLAKISEQLKNDLGWSDPSTLVTSGVSGGLFLTFLALINPGDEVIMADPYFVINKHVINMLGGKCVFVSSYPDFKLPVKGIADAITEKTKLIIVNSPANPTGAVYTNDELKQLADVARKNDLTILSDQIYDIFTYDGKCPSIAAHYDKTILLRGFSKSYAMTGWRLGYAAGTGAVKDIIEAMTKIQQYTFVCAPAPFQKAAIAAIDTDVSDYVSAYKKKRDLLYEGLKDKFEMYKQGGAFYAFIKAPDKYKNATEFVKKAISENILIIPGNVFSEQDTHFRISYATTDERIEKGIEILRKLA